ncbi:UDP-N-acetylglucosamine-N-acetylmuramylpentapeptide N-acetylglucosamine transferase [Granulicatella balaenopterae]|uniref:UDP-N-acetylglucosamine--N-acetylmuramyl-(pentapeptide) pyrophosphoryl-undecaprenol N-acetylglucosamine transferase n=1 Tax=Granulicatella balaenopterae TaxID=137733 RepID=A0A1H9ICG1_9LACT|nr:undecaprenyldiphospho-muramoylpentapeptide beta-N-acetylglucosaminyltransferase [Granulicatella balaenopterae]SEQ72277.1 UDP-N-acetylglucosamine-N-acetylmuramylpentapeptide N-acetylglucosamine transferase [Granulicatella balaenopterae]
MKIMVSGGGTGGHIYPALSLMKYIKEIEPTAEFLYVGTKKGLESKIVPEEGYDFASVRIQGLKRSLSFENFKTAFFMLKSVHDSKKIMKEFKPDVVIGTGGYVCAPVLYAAAKQGIPTMIHEQNSVAGLTNKFLARYVTKIAICFEDVKKDFAKYSDKVIMTGNPRGQEVVKTTKNPQQLQELGLNPEKPILVIFGGSRGAEKINQTIVDIYQDFADKPYQVVAVTGAGHYDKINKLITEQEKLLPQVHLFPYIKDMPNLFQFSDVVVCRSGATTLTELTALGLPSVLIPSPYVTNNHQQRNAESLVNGDAALMVLEKDLTKESLMTAINEVMDHPAKRQEMTDNAKKLGIIDANDRLFGIIQSIVKK